MQLWVQFEINLHECVFQRAKIYVISQDQRNLGFLKDIGLKINFNRILNI